MSIAAAVCARPSANPPPARAVNTVAVVRNGNQAFGSVNLIAYKSPLLAPQTLRVYGQTRVLDAQASACWPLGSLCLLLFSRRFLCCGNANRAACLPCVVVLCRCVCARHEHVSQRIDSGANQVLFNSR